MKSLTSFVVVFALAACSTVSNDLPKQSVVTSAQSGAPVRSAQSGNVVTGRDWANEPVESRGSGPDGKQ